MKKGNCQKAIRCFFCFSFLLVVNGFPGATAQAKEISLPMGEMIFRGDVRLEARENVWKKVDTPYIPVFQWTKIQTQKGQAIISLMNKTQIEIDENSLLSIDPNNVLNLFKGRVNFRIPVDGETSFKVSHLFVTKSLPLKVSRNPSMAAPKNEDFIGSLFIHSNGSLTVKSVQGDLLIVNQDHDVIASLPSKDSITIPSIAVRSSEKERVAQAGDTTAEEKEKEKEKDKFLGISTWGWVGIGGGVAAVAAIAAVAAGGGGGGGGGAVPRCK